MNKEQFWDIIEEAHKDYPSLSERLDYIRQCLRQAGDQDVIDLDRIIRVCPVGCIVADVPA